MEVTLVVTANILANFGFCCDQRLNKCGKLGVMQWGEGGGGAVVR